MAKEEFDKIQFYRGDKKDLPILGEGEPAITLDTGELHVGDGRGGNFQFARQEDVEDVATQLAQTEGDAEEHKLAELPHRLYDARRDISLSYGFEIDSNGDIFMLLEDAPEFVSIDNIAYEGLTLRDIFEGSSLDMNLSNTALIKDVSFDGEWLTGRADTEESVHFTFRKDLEEGMKYIIVYDFKTDRRRVTSTAHSGATGIAQVEGESEGLLYGVYTPEQEQTSIRVNFIGSGIVDDLVGVRGFFVINTNLFTAVPDQEEIERLRYWYLKLTEEAA